MVPQEFRPGGKNLVAGVVAVMAVYGYFLVFAQFGFLHALQNAPAGVATLIKPLLAAMGLAGIVGGLVAAGCFSVARCRAQLVVGFLLGAGAAGVTLKANSAAAFFAAAALVGLGAGSAAVTLSGMLASVVGKSRLGLVVGLGTGLAYGFCNLPVIFAGTAKAQAIVAIALAGLGAMAALQLAVKSSPEPARGFECSRLGVGLWTVIFITLVGLDSAAFAIIQNTPAFKLEMWTGAGQLAANAGTHFFAAVLAGWLLDRRGLGLTVAVGAAAMMIACLALDESVSRGGTIALLYCAGVSVYSTCLVFYPASIRQRWVAAVIFSIAGWGGSALGVTGAENRHELPSIFVGMAAGVIGLASGMRIFFLARHEAKTAAFLNGGTPP